MGRLGPSDDQELKLEINLFLTNRTQPNQTAKA